MRTGLVRQNPASRCLPETTAIHVWGTTPLRPFHLNLWGRPQNEREIKQTLQLLGLDRRLSAPLSRLYQELFALSRCGSVFTSEGEVDRRFHISTLVSAVDAVKAKELVQEIGAYLEG